MRKLGVLIVSTAVAIAVSPHFALAKSDKSSDNLLKNTATGKHYNKTTLTQHKPKTPVTEQKSSKKSGNIGNGSNNNHDSTGASASKNPNDNNSSSGASAHKNPNDNNSSSGASASKGPNNNPNASGAGTGKAKILTPDKVEAGGENIRR